MKINRRVATLTLLLLAISLALSATWPKDTLEAQSPTNDGSWKALGPEGGRVIALGLPPAFDTDGTLFAGTWGGGVFRSTDRGDTWQQVNQGLTPTDVRALGLSPTFDTDDTLFAGTCSWAPGAACSALPIEVTPGRGSTRD